MLTILKSDTLTPERDMKPLINKNYYLVHSLFTKHEEALAAHFRQLDKYFEAHLKGRVIDGEIVNYGEELRKYLVMVNYMQVTFAKISEYWAAKVEGETIADQGMRLWREIIFKPLKTSIKESLLKAILTESVPSH